MVNVHFSELVDSWGALSKAMCVRLVSRVHSVRDIVFIVFVLVVSITVNSVNPGEYFNH